MAIHTGTGGSQKEAWGSSLYANQHGRWDDAEELAVQVLDACKMKLGADHPDTMTGMANLSSTWKSQGRLNEAIELMDQCVQRAFVSFGSWTSGYEVVTFCVR